MRNPLVSVLIPCFNAAPYLRETLESALAQTHADLEIILVDDGSTDASLAIARDYEPRIKVLSGPRLGASAARNLATQESRGYWLQYLDADDILFPNAIATRLAAAEREGADVVCSDWCRIVPEPNGLWRAKKFESADFKKFGEDPDLAILNGFWAPPAALFYSRSIVMKIGGWHPSLPVIQDARFLFDAAFLGGRFVHLSGEGARYRQHSADSLSSRSRSRFWADVLKNNCEIEKLMLDGGKLDIARKSAVAKSYALGARVTFPIDRDLYIANLAELSRFPDLRLSRYARLASFLERLFGYSAAVRVMKLLKPSQHA